MPSFLFFSCWSIHLFSVQCKSFYTLNATLWFDCGKCSVFFVPLTPLAFSVSFDPHLDLDQYIARLNFSSLFLCSFMLTSYGSFVHFSFGFTLRSPFISFFRLMLSLARPYILLNRHARPCSWHYACPNFNFNHNLWISGSEDVFLSYIQTQIVSNTITCLFVSNTQRIRETEALDTRHYVHTAHIYTQTHTMMHSPNAITFVFRFFFCQSDAHCVWSTLLKIKLSATVNEGNGRKNTLPFNHNKRTERYGEVRKKEKGGRAG